MTTFVAGWIHVPSLLGVKVFGVGVILDTFFTEVLRMFYILVIFSLNLSGVNIVIIDS